MPRSGARRPRLLASVRSRTTAVAMLVVGLALAVCAVSLLVIVRRSLVRNVDEANEAVAEEVAARARAGSLAPRLPVPGGRQDEDLLIQVVDYAGRVMAASENYEGQPPLFSVVPNNSKRLRVHLRTTIFAPPIDRNDFRVLVLTGPTPNGPVSMIVASELEQTEKTVADLRRALTYGAPGLLLLSGILIWLLVGRALRPVESIRARVAEITDTALHRRVPEPGVDDEIGRLARTMNAMLDRLQSSAERQRRFVADASHELRSPLASTRAQLEVAVTHPDPDAWEATANDLLAENQRMERLVTDLLFLAGRDEGRAEAAPEPVDLDDVVLSEVARVRDRDRGRVYVDISRLSAGRVAGRAEHLGRMVRNIVENAERHAASTVTIELGGHDGHVELRVTDDGPGVPADQRDRVFDRFVRLDVARSRHHGGAGLGLAIAREIAAAHGGKIWVEDGAAGGARFVVSLPALEGGAQPAAPDRARATAPTSTAPPAVKA